MGGLYTFCFSVTGGNFFKKLIINYKSNISFWYTILFVVLDDNIKNAAPCGHTRLRPALTKRLCLV